MRVGFHHSWGKTVFIFIAILLAVQLLAFSHLWDHIQGHVHSFTSAQKSTESNPTPLLDPPSDYASLAPIQDWCRIAFGREYLEFPASHQLPYCEPGSKSGLQCFRTNRTDGMYASDSLCIAQGVMLHGNVEADLSLQCRLRNFTAEALTGNKEAVGVQNIESMHSYYYWTGIMEQLKTWKIQGNDDSGCSRGSGDGKWIFLCHREANSNLFHKLYELWQATISLDIVRMATDPSTGRRYLTPDEDSKVQVVFEDDREEPLDDWWTIVSENPPIRKSQLKPGCYKNVILPLPGSSSPFWILPGRGRNGDLFCKDTFLIDAFTRRIFRYLRVTPRLPRVPDHPVITIVDRKGTRKIYDIAKYTENLKQRYPDLNIRLVDFGTLNLREQALLAQETDIMIGHHGAGLTHILFMPEQSAVIEILPPIFNAGGFRQLCKMRQQTYFALNSLWVGDWEKVMGTGNGTVHPPLDESKWQEEEWAYILEKDFQSLVDAALWSQDYSFHR
jgi:EGF domain-specific O-GlcNAc transferase